MSETKFDVGAIVDDLKRLRDEIRVRVHLGKADAKDEWERLEGEWRELRGKLDVAGHEASKAAHEVGVALQLALKELRRGYERVRAAL